MRINDINRQSNGIVVAIDLERSTFKANNKVYGIGGVSPTICARDYKDPYRICYEE